MTDDFEGDFHEAMVDIYNEAAALGYHAHIFRRMLSEHGGLVAAKRLLAAPDEQAGLTRLWELKRLDLSVEAHVLDERWSSLFSNPEKEEAIRRLREYDYDPTTQN